MDNCIIKVSKKQGQHLLFQLRDEGPERNWARIKTHFSDVHSTFFCSLVDEHVVTVKLVEDVRYHEIKLPLDEEIKTLGIKKLFV